MARVAPLIAVSLAVAATAACFRERERLDVPTVSLTFDDTLVAAGDTIRGHIRASDGSGILLVRVRAESPVDTVLLRSDRLEDEQVDEVFTILVKETTPAGTRIRVTGSAVDNQDFEVFTDTAVRVKAP